MPIIGLKDLYFAKIIEDAKTGTTYSPPQHLAAAINATITPNTSTSTLYADDVAYATANSIGATEVSFEIAEIGTAIVSELLGVTKNAAGVLEYDDNINSPYVAIGFRSQLSDGTYKYMWLTKGSFNIPELSAATKGESVEFQPRTIAGQFITRESDRKWRFELDERDVVAGSEWVIAEWFNAVYDPAATDPNIV